MLIPVSYKRKEQLNKLFHHSFRFFPPRNLIHFPPSSYHVPPKENIVKLVLQDVTELFGLEAPVSEDIATQHKDRADMHPESTNDGSYESLTVTITHILNNKSGVNFGSYAHTGLPVEVFAQGVGQEEFDAYYDNTDIYDKVAALTGVE